MVGGLVLGQWALGPDYATRRGVHVGDSLTKVLTSYGSPSRTWSEGGGLVYTDTSPAADDRILYFEVRDGRVIRMYIGYLVD
jgi:predicted transcriptional regulator